MRKSEDTNPGSLALSPEGDTTSEMSAGSCFLSTLDSRYILFAIEGG